MENEIPSDFFDNSQLILASASQDRLKLLCRAGFNPKVLPARIDEHAILRAAFGGTPGWNKGDPRHAVMILAKAKCEAVFGKYFNIPELEQKLKKNNTDIDDSSESAINKEITNHWVIIGADTMIQSQGKMIGKPENMEEARIIISNLSGNWHEIFTGVSLIHLNTGKRTDFWEMTKVHFRTISQKEIDWYISEESEILTRAGCYSLRHRGAMFIDRIEGSDSNVIGLPLAKISEILFGLGFNPK